jgi:hypothetical protein
MTILYVNTGTSPNNGDGDSLRVSFDKINQNFKEVITAINTSTAGPANIVVGYAPPADPILGTLWFDSVKGRLYIWYDNFWVDPNPDALVGPPGPRGNQGIEGIQGLDGPQGPSGPRGVTGPIGFGVTGPVGGFGPPGNQGPSGPTGSIGLGYANLTSPTLVTVSSGVKVFQTNLSSGETAFNAGDPVLARDSSQTKQLFGQITFFTGNELRVNVTNSTGGGSGQDWTFSLAGTRGPSGPIGPLGPSGPDGIQGLNGLSGPSGPQGVGGPGPSGPRGPSGPAFEGGTLSNIVLVDLPNQSISTTTGAIVVTGGVGVGKNVTVGERLSFTQSQEPMQTLNGATGQVDHDCSKGMIFNHIGLTSNFTANFINLNLDQGYATNISLLLNQGSTPYIPTAVKIEGVAKPIYWQGNSIAPGGSPGKKEAVSFSIYNDVSAGYVVLGQLVSFG